MREREAGLTAADCREIDAFVNYVGAKSVEDMRESLAEDPLGRRGQPARIGPIVYGLFDRILGKIMNCELPNGGVIVIWSGNFLQKEPVGENLPDILVKTDVYGLKPPHSDRRFLLALHARVRQRALRSRLQIRQHKPLQPLPIQNALHIAALSAHAGALAYYNNPRKGGVSRGGGRWRAK